MTNQAIMETKGELWNPNYFGYLPLYEFYNVAPDDYADKDITLLHLGGRANRVMTRLGCKTVADLLNLTKKQLFLTRTVGILTYQEIMMNLEALLAKTEKTITQSPKVNMVNKQTQENVQTRPSIETLLSDKEKTFPDLTKEEQIHLLELKEALQLIDKDLCQKVFQDPYYGLKLCDMCEKFSFNTVGSDELAYLKAFDEARIRVCVLSEKIKNLPVIPFVHAYENCTDGFLSELFPSSNPDMIVSDVPNLFLNNQTKQDSLSCRDAIIAFLEWMAFDLEKQTAEIIKNTHDNVCKKSELPFKMFYLKASGKTLSEIGIRFSLSRERVRQVVKRVNHAFWFECNEKRYDYILLLYALKGGERVLYRSDFIKEYGDFGLFLWQLFYSDKKSKFSDSYSDPGYSYRYSANADAIIVSFDDLNSDDRKYSEAYIVKLFPDIFPVVQKDDLVEKISQEQALPVRVITAAFDRVYSRTGSFYHCRKIGSRFICEYLLKYYFPHGYKIASDDEFKAFRTYYNQIFGSQPFDLSKHAVDAQMAKIGILYDRGRYIHPDLFIISPEEMQYIYEIIEQFERPFLYYSTLYEEIKNDPRIHMIRNKYQLQGVLNKYGCPYYTGKDYVRKDNSVSIETEVDALMAHYGKLSIREILTLIPGIDSSRFYQVVERCPNVFLFDTGYYVHASLFHIKQEDYVYLRNMLQTDCAKIPIHSYTLLKKLQIQYPEFLQRNGIKNKYNLYSILRYMFQNEFAFFRPFISQLGDSGVTMASNLKNKINDRDVVPIQELYALNDYRRSDYVLYSELERMLPDEYIQINQSFIMKRELAGITEDVMDKTVTIMKNMLKEKDYIVGPGFADFQGFPKIHVEWTAYLLQAIIERNGEIPMVHRQGRKGFHVTAIYLSEKYRNDSYESFLIKLLKEDVQNGYFQSKEHLCAWLKDHRLIGTHIPNFIHSKKYFFSDSTGVHFKE